MHYSIPKEYYSDLVALVDLGYSFVVIDEHQHRNLKPNTEPVNILLKQQFIRINKNIRLSDLTHFLISNLRTQNVYSTQEALTHDDIDNLGGYVFLLLVKTSSHY